MRCASANPGQLDPSLRATLLRSLKRASEGISPPKRGARRWKRSNPGAAEQFWIASSQRTTRLKILMNFPRYALASPTFSGRFALPVVARCGPILAVDALASHGSFRPPLRNLRARARVGVNSPSIPV